MSVDETMRYKQQWQVTLFLMMFKKLSQNLFTFADRESSLGTLARLGITVKQAKEEILGLTYKVLQGPNKRYKFQKRSILGIRQDHMWRAGIHKAKSRHNT